MAHHAMKYFEYKHLPERLQLVSRPFGELAEMLDAGLPDGDQKTIGMQKLIEAKDCFVRANLPEKG